MKKIYFLLAVMICHMFAMTAAAQDLSGVWQFDNLTSTTGENVEMHLSGKYSFDKSGIVHAAYKIIGVTANPSNDAKVKSVYFELSINGDGKYRVADNSLDIILDKTENSFRMGEGTYDNMGPAYKDGDKKGEEFVRTFFTAFSDMLAEQFKNVRIKNINVGNNEIQGTLMDTPVTLTKAD